MHPNKHIREALKYAEEHGWRIVISKGHAYLAVAAITIVKSRSGRRLGILNSMRGTFETRLILVPEE